MLPYNKPILWPIVSFKPAMCFAAIICYHQCEQETQQMKWLSNTFHFLYFLFLFKLTHLEQSSLAL